MKPNNDIQALKQRIQAARAEIPADLVLKRGKVVNVFSGMIHESDIAIYDGFTVGLGDDYHGREEIDLKGKWIIPGLIDGHTHIAWMYTVSEFLKYVIKGGTTTVVTETMEPFAIAGYAGVVDFLESLNAATAFLTVLSKSSL